jgi:hypothetical protein
LFQKRAFQPWQTLSNRALRSSSLAGFWGFGRKTLRKSAKRCSQSIRLEEAACERPIALEIGLLFL